MDDKKLTELLQKLDIPEPDNAMKNSAFSSAMQEFEEKQKISQGKGEQGRPTPITANWLNLIGRNFMKKGTLIGGTAIALVLAVAVNGVFVSQDLVKVREHTQPKEQAAVGEMDSRLRGNDEETGIVQLSNQDDVAERPNYREIAKKEPSEKAKAVIIHLQELEARRADPVREEVDKNINQQREEGVYADLYAPSPDVPSSPKPAIGQGSAVQGNSGIMVQDMAAGNFRGLAQEQESVSRHLIVAPQPSPDIYPQQQVEGRDKFEEIKDNPVKLVAEEPVSTFSIDVDTSSYSFVRRSLNGGQLPDANQVRVEEMVNYFDYDYALPESKAEPFAPTVAVYPTPWNADTQLLHIGIKGYDIPASEKPHANLVFLIDTSGSMNQQDKLPLLRTGFKMMVENLSPEDTISIVTYAGSAGTALEPTKVADKQKILNALDNLHSGGGTAGAAGVKQAYALAQENFDKEGINRVILATDGDFNIGISNPEELKKYIEEKRKTGISLSVLGFGKGNYNDELMQKLAQNGNGNAAYIDNVNEARKVLVDEAGSTLFTIAKDVKLQVEFNPTQIAEYRLVGYQTRTLNREDFNNDKVDAGDIGSGHTVTAIYEITPVGSAARKIDDLRYGAAEKQEVKPAPDSNFADELAFLKIRYKLPDSDTSTLITRSITSKDVADSITRESTDVQFAAAVTAFGQLLRKETHMGNFTFDDVLKLAEPARGKDSFGYRTEFLNMVRTAKALHPGMVIENEQPIQGYSN